MCNPENLRLTCRECHQIEIEPTVPSQTFILQLLEFLPQKLICPPLPKYRRIECVDEQQLQQYDALYNNKDVKISDFQTTLPPLVRVCPSFQNHPPSPDVRVRIFQFLHIFIFAHLNKVYCPIPVFIKLKMLNTIT